MCSCERVCELVLQVEQLTGQLDEVQLTANQASEMLESEQLEKRELQEELSELMVGLEGYLTRYFY